MYRGNSRAIPVLVLIVIVVIAVIGLVIVGRSILSGATKTTQVDDPANTALLTTDSDDSVRMTVRGPIVANEEAHSYQVIISPTNREIIAYSGYDNQILSDNQYTNNSDAYTQFVYALGQLNYTKGAKLTDQQNDTRGVCATGRLYTYEVLQAGSAIKSLWTTNCSGENGSFRGQSAAVRALFLNQIPNYNDVLAPLIYPPEFF